MGILMLLPELNLYNLPVLVAALLNIGLILFVCLRSSWQPIHRVFVAWNLALVVWNIGSFGAFGAASDVASAWWTRFCGLGVVWIPATFLHLVLVLRRDRTSLQRYLLWGAYLMGALLFTGTLVEKRFLVAGAMPRFWGWGPVGGVGATLLDLIMVAGTIYSLALLKSAAGKALDVRRNQLLYVFWGALVGYAGGGINVLVIHGANIYPFGNIVNIFYSLAVAYAIVSYQWMDIRLALRQGVVYGSLGAALTLTYATVVLLIEKSLTANLGNGWGARLLALPPTFFMAPILKNRIQPWVEQRFFSEWERAKKKLQELGMALCACMDLRKIGETAVRCCVEELGMEGASFWLWEQGSERLNRIAARESEPGVSNDSFQPEWLRPGDSRALFTRDLEWRLAVNPNQNAGLRPLARWLAARQAAMAIPVWFQNRFLGVWVLGARRSGNMWPRDVISKFQETTRQLALAIHNGLAVQALEERRGQLEKTREMAMMGTLATEMAHELTKPLTRILNAESSLQRTMRDDSRGDLARIEKETLRASEMLESFSMLSPHLPLHRAPVPLMELIDETLELLGLQEDRSIRIVREIDSSASAFVNRGQMVQVLTNLIQNAWQAMPEGGALTLSLRTLSNVVEIGITDTGAGISPENRGRVFEAFFTTRKPQGGRGLGLTISRAMVERHGGTLRLESPAAAGQGTRAVVCLPIMPMEEWHEA